MKFEYTNFTSEDKFKHEKYPKTGFYSNADESGTIDWFFVNKVSFLVAFIGSTELDSLFNTEESAPIQEKIYESANQAFKEAPASINEKTLLKAIAVASGYVNYKEI